MKIAEFLLVALQIWFCTVVINGLLIGFWTSEWNVVLPLVIMGTVVTLPLPFVASYCIKVACLFSDSFGARFRNVYFLLLLLAGLFWAVIIAILGGFAGEEKLTLLISSNFLSLLIACLFSIKQLKRLAVTSKDTVIS